MYYFGTILLWIFFTSVHEDFHLYPPSRAICKQLLNHGGKLARIHHAVAEFTKYSDCLPSILIVDNCIFLLGLSNHARLDIRRFGSGIRIHPKVRIASHRIYETMFAWYM